jgi:hypothetical protein
MFYPQICLESWVVLPLGRHVAGWETTIWPLASLHFALQSLAAVGALAVAGRGTTLKILDPY